MNNNLDRIESQLRTLFEESLLKIFTGNHSPTNLIDELVSVIRKNLEKSPEGDAIAPDRLVFHVSPKDLPEWQAHQDTLNEIAATLHQLSQQYEFEFQSVPTIELRADPEVSEHDVLISSVFDPQKSKLPDTAAMDQPDGQAGDNVIPANAFLVVGGKTNFPLDKAVVDIGRHSDNDLVIDDQYVSRHHAQLRAINRRYVVFDVGSTGGLFLNGNPVSQATLQPGDVIRIGTVNLIYIQDSTSPNSTTAIPINSESHQTGGEQA